MIRAKWEEPKSLAGTFTMKVRKNIEKSDKKKAKHFKNANTKILQSKTTLEVIAKSKNRGFYVCSNTVFVEKS